MVDGRRMESTVMKIPGLGNPEEERAVWREEGIGWVVLPSGYSKYFRLSRADEAFIRCPVENALVTSVWHTGTQVNG